jgi:hypothetical protein
MVFDSAHPCRDADSFFDMSSGGGGDTSGVRLTTG